MKSFAFVLLDRQLSSVLLKVERVKEYCELKQENLDGETPPLSWPSQNGEIVVDKLSVKYQDDLGCVLHNLSFTIKPKVWNFSLTMSLTKRLKLCCFVGKSCNCGTNR